MAQLPYYGSHYRFTEPPPPEPQQPTLMGLDPLSLLIIGAVAWWGWKKGWWGKAASSPAQTIQPAQPTQPAQPALPPMEAR